MIKITPQNYNSQSGSIPFAKMPKDLADTHGEMPMYLEFYGQDKEITEVVDLYLQKVNQIINAPVKCTPTVKTVYKDKIVKEPCKCPEKEAVQVEEKSFTDKLKDPIVIGSIVAGVVIGKII